MLAQPYSLLCRMLSADHSASDCPECSANAPGCLAEASRLKSQQLEQDIRALRQQVLAAQEEGKQALAAKEAQLQQQTDSVTESRRVQM